jgi:cytoskeleton protein RodZ
MNAMANEELIESAPSQISESRGPGEILTYERNRLGQSVEGISQYLHLSADVVRALEDDRYDDLPEPTYVRGYIRSYARHLGLDVEPLIQSYNELIQPKTQASPEKEVRAAVPLKRKNVSWVTWGGLLLMVALMAVWGTYDFALPVEVLRIAGWKGAAEVGQIEPGGVSPRQETAKSAEPVTPEIAARTEDRVATKVAPINRSYDNESKWATETALPPNTEHETEPESKTEPSNPVVTAQGAEAAGQEEAPLHEAESQTELAAPVTPATQFELAGRTAPGADTLQLTFEGESWTEIYDANNERLLFGLMNSGAVKNVQGTAPFRVLLGNSPAVKIQFNGKPFDQSRFGRWDKTARFKVDESSAN